MAKSQRSFTPGITIFLENGGVNLVVREEGKQEQRDFIPSGSLKDFSWNRKKSSIKPEVRGTKKLFVVQLGASTKPVNVWLTKKGNFFGSFDQEDRSGPVISFEELFESCS